MAKLVVVHTNTEIKEITLDNDKIAWINLMKNDGTTVKFFAERRAE